MSALGPCMIQGIVFTHFDKQNHEARARSIQGALKKTEGLNLTLGPFSNTKT